MNIEKACTCYNYLHARLTCELSPIYINSNCNTSVIKMQKAQEILGKVTGGAVGHKLPTAKLGKNGPQVTRMGYGAMGLVSCDPLVAAGQKS